ncbi:MAG TPA: SPOR domain-containing protein [Quisquiliibacterium sp.]|nr:SPOR domain-containing protein [Quisquiliibacterium sp.]HQN13624.1 SPOR domain-containing protein [Quisquiliibacterium sp.]HQP67278.1 SPOR domain-containing protein [Quisquiliibacterium sp.]
MASRSSSAKAGGALDPALPQKKRARRRLVGALAVCVAAAIVLPLVLDSEPRQVRPDVQVQIPSRDTPLNERLPGTSRSGVIDPSRPADAAGETSADRAAGAGSAGQGGTSVSGTIGSGKPESGKDAAGAVAADAATGAAKPAEVEARPLAGKATDEHRQADGGNHVSPEPTVSDAKTDAKTDAKASKSADARPSDAKSAEVKSADTKSTDTKPTDAKSTDAKSTDAKATDPKSAEAKAKDTKAGYLLQAGAFSAAKGASEQVERVRAAGLKAYTEKVQTPNGERIRVRLGPYPDRQAAERARDKLRAAGLESTLIAP